MRGLTAAGSQRWFCSFCKSSATKPRLDLRKKKVSKDHGKWLLGKQSQKDFVAKSGGSTRQFRRKTAWCWDTPSLAALAQTGEAHHAIIIDGIRIGNSICLIARTVQYVIGWTWVPYESNEYWSRLLVTLPPPTYIVCDGQKGMLKALKTLWPNTIVQRCRFHAWSNIRTKLTLHPESAAGQQLLVLGQALLNVHSKREARIWKHQLKSWYAKHHGYIDQRTVNPDPSPGQRKWRYTHDRVRSAYRQLHKITDDLLRSSYRSHPQLPRNTNYVEGGINSQLRTKLKDHRGMSFEHQMKLVEKYLYSRTEAAKIQADAGQKPPRKTF